MITMLDPLKKIVITNLLTIEYVEHKDRLIEPAPMFNTVEIKITQGMIRITATL